MKRLFTAIAMMLFPFILLSQGNNEYYFYYRGEKQYLELNTDYIFLSSEEPRVPLSFVDLFDTQNSVFHKLEKGRSNAEKCFWSELKIKNGLSEKEYFELIQELKCDDGVQTVSSYFKMGGNIKIGLSNFFYVKLLSISDTVLLRELALKYKCLIVEQDTFMPLWFTLSVTKESNYDAMELANMFFENKAVQLAEPDFIVDNLAHCASDTYFSNQWGLKNTGQQGGITGIDVKICSARNISKGSGVIVAVLDHGILRNHSDLATNSYALSYDTETGTSPSVVWGSHGTACAGVVGADDNIIGICGVAPDCQLMSISNKLNTNVINIKQKLADGISWAWQNEADVISNSWGSNALQSGYIDDAISDALTLGRNGLGSVVVFSSGNNNQSSVEYPSSTQGVIAVGAIDRCGVRSGRIDIIPNSCDPWGSNSSPASSYGYNLSVVAPGTKIYTTDLLGNAGYNFSSNSSDISDRDYTGCFGGTSAACPHVAGVAALILAVNPALTVLQVKTIIEQTAQKVGSYNYSTTIGHPNGTWNNEMGYGLVDAYAAVMAAIPSPCTGTTNFVNQTVNSSATVTGCNINAQNVVVRFGFTLVLDATDATTINGSFEIQQGSSLEVR